MAARLCHCRKLLVELLPLISGCWCRDLRDCGRVGANLLRAKEIAKAAAFINLSAEPLADLHLLGQLQGSKSTTQTVKRGDVKNRMETRHRTCPSFFSFRAFFDPVSPRPTSSGLGCVPATSDDAVAKPSA